MLDDPDDTLLEEIQSDLSKITGFLSGHILSRYWRTVAFVGLKGEGGWGRQPYIPYSKMPYGAPKMSHSRKNGIRINQGKTTC